MAQKHKDLKINRPLRLKLSTEESLKRTKDFDKRRERFIAAVRQGLDDLERGESVVLEDIEGELPSWIALPKKSK